MSKRYQYVTSSFSGATLAIAISTGMGMVTSSLAYAGDESQTYAQSYTNLSISPTVDTSFSVEDFRRELQFNADTRFSGRLKMETQVEMWLLPNYTEQFNELPRTVTDDDDDNEIGEIEHTVKLGLMGSEHLPAISGFVELALPLENNINISGYSPSSSEISFGFTFEKEFSWGNIESKLGYRDSQGSLQINEYSVGYSRSLTDELALGIDFEGEREKTSVKSQLNWSPISDMSMQFFGKMEFNNEDTENIIGTAILFRF